MTLTDAVAKRIIRKLLRAEDYRIEIVTLLDAQFLQFVIEFFKKIVDAKFKNESITDDWYKSEFLDSRHDKDDIAVHSGMNLKTIGNMYNTTKREVVIDASTTHYDVLYESIRELTEAEESLGLTLELKFNDVSVKLSINETLIVINTLAVKRAALRGGLWSTAGKRVEKPLMQTLCELYGVPEKNYEARIRGADQIDDADFFREVDFYLVDGNAHHKCEVKLMGRGNPESADAIFARGSRVFVADKLSDTNKKQLNYKEVEWVELQSGFQRFETVLKNLSIPHATLDVTDLDAKIETIFKKVFGETL